MGFAHEVALLVEGLEGAVFEPPVSVEPVGFGGGDFLLVGAVGSLLPKGDAVEGVGSGVDFFDGPGVADSGVAVGDGFGAGRCGALFFLLNELVGLVAVLGAEPFVDEGGEKKGGDGDGEVGL